MAEKGSKEFADKVVEKFFKDALDEAGIDNTRLAKKIDYLLDAIENRAQYDQILCEWKISPPLAALHIQLKATDMALKLLGAYPKEEIDVRHSVAPDLEKRLRQAQEGRVDDREGD